MRNGLIKIPVLPTLLVAVLVPTNLAFLRETFLPSLLPPSVVLGSLMLLILSCKGLHHPSTLPTVPIGLLIPYLGLTCLMLVTLIFTREFEFGLTKVIEFGTITMLACFAPIFVFRDSPSIKSFLKVLIIVGTSMAGLIVVTQFSFQSEGFWTPFGSNYLAVQHMAGMAGITILYYSLLRSRKLIEKVLWALVFVSIMAGLLYAGGKGPVLTFLVTTFVMAALSIRHKRFLALAVTDRRILFYPFAVLILGVALLAFIIASQGTSLFLTRTELVLTPGHYDQAQRLDNAEVAIDLFLQNPVLGAGIGSFANYAVQIDEAGERLKYPHNVIIEVLAELGIIGFAFFSYALARSFRHLLQLQKLHKEDCLPRVFLGLTVFTFLNALTSGYIANPALFAFVGAPYAIEFVLRQVGSQRNSFA